MSDFEQGGMLTDAVDQHPHAVLLLDEIEKAHPDIYNILLQVMDSGRLTDHNGKTMDFRNVMLIMTTNAGAADMAKPAIGFRLGHSNAGMMWRRSTACSRRSSATVWTPSSRSRRWKKTIGRVVDKFVMELEAQLADRRVTIELSEAARKWLGVKRATIRRWAPVRFGRVIQENLKKPLAEEILFGSLTKGGTVKVDMADGKLTFSYVSGAEEVQEHVDSDDADSSSENSGEIVE
jgi:ATP-dependent Clp protease ATP-binding subunit ClpA